MRLEHFDTQSKEDASRSKQNMTDADTEQSQAPQGRSVYTKRDSVILTFLLLALTEGVSVFILGFRYTTLNSPSSPFQSTPWWLYYNSLLGMSTLNVFTYLAFPVLLFVALYAVGDSIQLKENLVPLCIAMALGGLIGATVGGLVAELIFLPASLNVLSYLQFGIGIFGTPLQAFYFIVIGFSAILFKQLRTKAVWIV